MPGFRFALAFLVPAISLAPSFPAGAGWGPAGCPPPPVEAPKPVPVEPVYLEVEGLSCQDDVTKATEALRTLPGVKGVSVRLESGEAVVSAPRGAVRVSAMVSALSKLGLKSREQERDTWHFQAPSEQSGTLRNALQKVEGVTAAWVDPQGDLCVTGRVPHVSTERLLQVMKSLAPKSEVRTEKVSLTLKGAADGTQAEEALKRLAKAHGVLEAKGGAEGMVEISREKGRAPVSRLNRALEGTGMSVESAG